MGATGTLYHRNPEIEAVIHKDSANQDAWLIYADWLQSVGDPRGKLISLEMAVNVTDIKNQAAINNEIRSIYAQHKDKWLGPALSRAEKSGAISFRWKYGFIHRVACVSRFVNGEYKTFEPYLEDIFKSDELDFLTAIDFGNRSYTSRSTVNLLLSLWKQYPKRHLVSLDLRYNYMSKLPKSLGEFSQIRRLNLAGNALDDIPESLSRLSNLTHLNLSFNHIGQVPEWIGSLENLTELNLRNNRILNLPETIGELSDIRELDLAVNRLNRLPMSFGRLKQLERLYLSSNMLSSISESISALENLTKLDAGYNDIRFVPDSLSNLEYLTELHLSCNRISSIPDSLENNKMLRTLYLYGNDNMRISDALKRRFKVGKNMPW